MPDSTNIANDEGTALSARELPLKDREFELRELEVRSKLATERRNVWFTSPILVAVLSAIVGLLGTGIGAVLQGYWNTTLERQKFESALIQKALETPNKNEAAQNLQFLVDAGLITSFDANKITALAKKPDQLPTLFRTEAISPKEAKALLARLGLYAGPIDDQDTPGYRAAVRAFQSSRKLMADAMIGPITASVLRGAVQESGGGAPPAGAAPPVPVQPQN